MKKLMTQCHTALAKGLLLQDWFLAWGDLGTSYPDTWGPTDTPPDGDTKVVTINRTKGAANGVDATTYAAIDIVSIISIVGAVGPVTYVQGRDYYLNGANVNWSLTAGGAIEPTPGSSYTLILRVKDNNQTTLVRELGRRQATVKEYVIPDNAGPVSINGENWTAVNYPTRYLHLSFRFTDTENLNTTIYQVAAFVGTTRAAGVPSGQEFLLPAQVLSPGLAYFMDYIPPTVRNVGHAESFDYIIKC